MKRILAFAIAAISLASNAQNDNYIFANLPAEYQNLLKDDIMYANIGHPLDQKTCLEDREGIDCKLRERLWIRSTQNKDVLKFFESIANKPPHIKEPLMSEAFTKLYDTLLPLKDKNICVDEPLGVGGNNITTSDNKFYQIGGIFAPADGVHFLFVSYKLLSYKGKFLSNKIPAQYITEDFYSKVQQLNWGSFMRTCGKFTGRLKDVKNFGYPIDRQMGRTDIFDISKPIELYKDGGKTPFLTIPFSWYGI